MKRVLTQGALRTRNRKLDPKAVFKELTRIKKKYGELLPEYIVKESQKSTAFFHDSFEWDNAVAAYEHRLEQARGIIRIIADEHILDGKKVRTRTFSAVVVKGTESSKQHRRAYENTTDILKDDDLRAQLLAQAIRDLKSFKIKYEGIKELAVVLNVATRTIKKFS